LALAPKGLPAKALLLAAAVWRADCVTARQWYANGATRSKSRRARASQAAAAAETCR
jgi:hypothetical protein